MGASKIPRVLIIAMFAGVCLVSYRGYFYVFKTALTTFLFETLYSKTKSFLIKMAIGGVACVGLAGGVLLAVGLSPLGPIAGSLFAAAQGAGVVSGSFMAIAQSLAMTGSYVGPASIIGAILGAVAAYKH